MKILSGTLLMRGFYKKLNLPSLASMKLGRLEVYGAEPSAERRGPQHVSRLAHWRLKEEMGSLRTSVRSIKELEVYLNASLARRMLLARREAHRANPQQNRQKAEEWCLGGEQLGRRGHDVHQWCLWPCWHRHKPWWFW